uniref:Putative ribonuclease H-like domain-containing protein n=1 Tax=Tanacetum cinerariifolium TaxID=118510 RepID=A0A6L2KG82_TANCI|nr:putative ribonuclease H-like domain-containing protein [Tanacetum cinerariifolium]
MNTKIFIDNQSTIFIVKNLVFHQRTKHIEIQLHFIRDANEKNLIQVVKIHTDENVADLLTKAFDGPRFHYLVLLLVVLVRAIDLVPAGSCIIPTVFTHIFQAYHICSVFHLSRLHEYFSMATLQYKDDHNKVAYLKKGKGWEAYEQILDFLHRSHIRYALTHRLRTVFDSLVQQFWATATVHNHEARPSQIIANIDGIQTTNPSPRPTFDFTAKLFSNMKLNWDGPYMPLLASMLVVPAGCDGADAVAAGATTAHDVLPPSVPTTHSSSSIPGPSSAPQSSPVREPTTVREPIPRHVREPTPDSPRPPSPPPRLEEVGLTTSTRPPSPTKKYSFYEAPQTPVATAAGGAEESATLTALSLKLDRCINRVTSLENKLSITKKVLGGAVLKLVTRVKRLEGLLQQRKRRLHILGGDSNNKAAGHDAAEVPAYATMPFRSTSITRRRLRKPFTSSTSAYVHENIPAGAGILAAATTILAGSSMDAAVYATAAPSSPIPDVDKGKAPMVDDSLPTDLLSEQQEELEEKAQAKRVASPTEHGPGLSDQRRRELDAAQLIYTEADWVELLAKIATNSTLSKQLFGDDVTEDNMNERLGWTMKKVKALSIAQLQHEFEYIQRHFERSNLLNFRRSTFRPKPTLDAPSAKMANQGVPQVPAASSQVYASVYDVHSFAVDVSVSAATTPEVPAAEYVVPTGRIIVPTGMYVVPTGRIIVATGRYVVPVGSDNESDNASAHNEATNTQQQPNILTQIITTVSNNNAKFPYLKKDKGTYCCSEGIKGKNYLLQSIPDDHVADFHYMDDARDIWNSVKARFSGNAESKKIRKSMLKQEFSEFRTCDAG